MEDRLSYAEFQRWVNSFNSNLRENHKYEYMIPKINEFIDQEEIEVFYPRNILVNEKPIELIFFTNDKIYRVCAVGEDDYKEEIKFEVISLKDVIDYSFNTFKVAGVENIELAIRFTNDRELKFNAHDETNVHRRNTYVSKIKQILKML